MKVKTCTWGFIIGLLLMSLQSMASDRIWIQWDANMESDLHHYVVYRSDAAKSQPDAVTDQVGITEAPYYVDENVTQGTTYYYWVSSVDNFGNTSISSGPLIVIFDENYGEASPESRQQSFIIEHIDEDQYSTDPFIDRTLDNDNEIEFTWTPANSDDVHYILYLSLNNNPDAFALETIKTSYTFENAANGDIIRLRVDVLDESNQLIARGFSDVIHCAISDSQIIPPGIPKVWDLE